jgi:hypothetical protein
VGGRQTACQYQSYDYWEDDMLHVCTKVMTTGRMIYSGIIVRTKAMTTGRMIYSGIIVRTKDMTTGKIIYSGIIVNTKL